MKLLSPAKINLFLHIIGKRPDGYHDLVSLMCCVGLYDIVSLDFGNQSIAITCSHPMVPQNHTNLAYQAAELFLNAINQQTGVSIVIEKHIPVGAGLGGGSSNAATVMQGLNRHYGKPLSRAELVRLGCSMGADVPFFFDQKPALATGMGERLEPYNGLKPFSVVLVYPGFSLSTTEMYKIINLGLTKCREKFNLNTFKNQDFDITKHLCNDFETVADSKHPEIGLIKEALLKQGAVGALMSGSGSSVFGLFCDAAEARKARDILSKQTKWQIFNADLIV
jgi:4-diphosphocytidyl-2-C-methyl-D-erythritol kinase